MITIYHNPRCRKSREGLGILEEAGKDFKVVKYLETPLTKEKLREILTLLDIPAEKLVRKGEAIWKERYKGHTLSEEALIDAMVEHPKLMERPIVINGSKAIIGRPPEAISSIL